MKYIINADGATIHGRIIRCDKCGGADVHIKYCHCHDGKETQEIECTCGNKIKIELEEVK